MLEPPLLLVFCLLSIPSNSLGTQNVTVAGGTRVKNIGVDWVLPANSSGIAGKVSPNQTAAMNEILTASGVSDLSTVLVVRPSSDGDFSTYTLALVNSTNSGIPPAGFDPVISRIEFGFKAECPSDFDCMSEVVCPPEKLDEPVIDYMAKDYESFRSLMLDRLSLLMPKWQERHPADMGVALVELLAYVGDQLSYYQDAVSTEAYLGTARERVSVRRHGRLLDYHVHDGCNARAWVTMEVSSPPSGIPIPGGTILLTGGPEDKIIVKQEELVDALANAQAFQTMTDAVFFTPKNEIDLYAWGDPECCIEAGGTSATLDNSGNALDILVFNWSKVPGSDSAALQEFIANRYGLTWPAEPEAQVTKSAGNDQIIVSNGFHSAAITLSADNSRATMAIDGRPADEFVMLDGTNVPPNPATMAAYAHTVRIGDVLILEEVRSPTTGKRADADPTHRFAVRLTAVRAATDPLGNIATGGEAAIAADAGSTVASNPLLNVEWDVRDALPFTLCLQQVIDPDSGSPGPVSAARGNVVLADQGCIKLMERFPYQPSPPLPKPYSDSSGFTQFTEYLGFTPVRGKFRPKLLFGPMTHSAPVDVSAPAASGFNFDPRDAVPDLLLLGEQQVWRPVRDLLASDKFAYEFVEESDNAGGAFIRFGDDDYGQAPQPSTDGLGNPFFAAYRLGGGASGNVGREAISRIVEVAGPYPMDADFPAWANSVFPPNQPPFDPTRITRIRNPMEAAGGVDPESIEDVKQFAPAAFKTQERAVTSADYEALLLKYPGVQRAYARLRWTGSWYTYFISVDRIGGAPLDAAFRQGVLNYLDGYRLAGYDLEVTNPTYVPLQVSMFVCVTPGFSTSDVKEALLLTFSNRVLPDGTTGFFHPDNFTFGQPVYLSQLYERALSVPGVDSVDVDMFQRWGRNPADEIQMGVIEIADSEVARLDNDPNFPENGRIDFVVEGDSH